MVAVATTCDLSRSWRSWLLRMFRWRSPYVSPHVTFLLSTLVYYLVLPSKGFPLWIRSFLRSLLGASCDSVLFLSACALTLQFFDSIEPTSWSYRLHFIILIGKNNPLICHFTDGLQQVLPSGTHDQSFRGLNSLATVMVVLAHRGVHMWIAGWTIRMYMLFVMHLLWALTGNTGWAMGIRAARYQIWRSCH